jgi:Zn-dependent protease with chaperone function
MSTAVPDNTKVNYTRSFFLPALLVFVIPITALLFFWHVQTTYDNDYRASALKQLNEDQSIPADEKAEMIELYKRVPVSRLILHPQFAESVDSQLRIDYATFRWMIRLSMLSIASVIVVFIFTLICVRLSRRSQWAQYYSLLINWQVLKIDGALQTIISGILIVALSFWVTAFWGHIYVPKLIFIAGFFAFFAVCAVLYAIFTNPKSDFSVAGDLLTREKAPSLWRDLETICENVGTTLPDQVIAGIDDNFFVTEAPVTVKDKKYEGKTLFVSLPLLKQLNSTEADNILAHEMAHFSGEDTVYTKRISPLLHRYEKYLQALYNNIITLPVFYYMLCFRMLFEFSIQKHSREREFRADAIAASITSPQDSVRALLKTAAYSKFRVNVQNDLFKQEKPLEDANIAGKIEEGFYEFTRNFASDSDIGDTKSAHPFDTHPTTNERLSAMGIALDEEKIRLLLEAQGDGGWYHDIPQVEDLEQQQWQEFEELFRKQHEFDLAHRYLPESPAEQALVEKHFPELTYEGKKENFVIVFDKLHLSTWDDPIMFHEITNNTIHDDGKFTINFKREGAKSRFIKTKNFKEKAQEIVQMIELYYSRHLISMEYQKLKKAEADENK